MTTPAAKSLRKAINRERGPAEGTVVRFTRRIESSYDPLEDRQVNTAPKDLTYAALFIAGKWWLTGHFGVPRPGNPTATRSFSHQAFTHLIADTGVRDVRIVKEWERV